MKKFSIGSIVSAAVILLLASAGVAFATLTLNGSNITGDSNSIIDATGTIALGTISATGITIGRSGITSTFPGGVSVTGTTTYLQNLILNGTCTGCTGAATPAPQVTYVPAGVSDGGVGYAAGLTRYDNNEPQSGSVNPASSALGYLAFNASPVSPQYAEQTIALPPYWTGTYLYINFYSAATTGNVVWEIQSACTALNGVVGSTSFGAPVTVTTAVSSVSGGLVTTASTTVAANGANGCPALGATSPTLMTYRIFRASSDSASGNANLLGVTLVTGRSQ